MKRSLFFIVSIVSAFVMSACNDDVVEERDVNPYEDKPGVTDPDRFDGNDKFDMPEDFELPDSEEDLNRVPDYDTNEGIRDKRDRITDDTGEEKELENTVD